MGIYLDHNATSPLRAEARARWIEALDELSGNASSLHGPGRRARHLLDEARERVAGALDVSEDELTFTSGGTEANNLAVLGAVRADGDRRRGLVTTEVEHSAVLEAADQLGREGYPVQRVPVTADGRVDPDVALRLVRAAAPRLVSVMATNNEIGARMPLAPLGAGLAALEPRPLFHTDAVQALGKSELHLRRWQVDLASFSSHKVGGPVGVGVLYRRKDVPLQPLMFGGGQEGGLRPGTEDVAAIVAAAVAIELAVREREDFMVHVGTLERDLWSGVRTFFENVRLLGPPLGSPDRQPGTLALLFPNVDGKVLVTRLDLAGLEVSAGSACASGALEPSHVLRAMGASEDEARAALRLSLGRATTLEDVRQAVDILRTTLG